MQPLYKDKVFVHQKYVVEGLSIKEIARQIFSSKAAISNALKRFDIPVREAHKPHNGRVSCPKYGTKLRSGRASPHVAEQQMIETIKELRAQGLTLRKVAEVLTNMRVPTKKRGKSWHPEMVKRILDHSTIDLQSYGKKVDGPSGLSLEAKGKIRFGDFFRQLKGLDYKHIRIL